MLDVPKDLTCEDIAVHLRTFWGIEAVEVAYAPVGHGSYNWTAHGADGADWFVKVDRIEGEDSRFYRATYETAATLRDLSLDFVHAAKRDHAGELRRPVPPDWEMAVFSLIHGRNTDFYGAERAKIAEGLGRLHAFNPIPEASLRWEPGFRQAELRRLLADDLDRPWDEGPYGEPAHALFALAAEGVHQLFARHDRLVRALDESTEPWVITHGEPHGGNTMVDTNGDIHLIDCDAMLCAPRERDLWLLLYGGHQKPLDLDNDEVIAAYQRSAGPVWPRPFVLELFRAEWHLMEISSYAQEFSDVHADTEDTAGHWKAFKRYLPITQNWPDLAH